MAIMFAMYATTDADAHLRAPIVSAEWGDRRNMPWWDRLDGQPVQPRSTSSASTTSRPPTTSSRSDSVTELYVTRQARPILATQSPRT